MNPRDAMTGAVIIATLIVFTQGDVIAAAGRGGWDHGRAQAAAELRRARREILARTRDTLRARLDGGRAAGPGTGWWWAWAALRAGKALRGAMRGTRTPAGIGPDASGPVRRIIRAAAVGARARARRRAAARPWRWSRWPRPGTRSEGAAPAGEDTGGPAEPDVMAVCDGCGAIVAAASLQWAPWPFPDHAAGAATGMLCLTCRNSHAPAPEPGTESAPEPGTPEPAAATGPDERKEPAGPAGTTPDEGKEPQPMTRIALTGGGTLAAPSGEAYTHGAVLRAGEALAGALEKIPVMLDSVTGNLTTVNASNRQINGVLAWADQVTALTARLRAMAVNIDRREGRLVDAIGDVGGPCQVADSTYMAEV